MERHKKKLIFTGVVVGGGYVVYKWYLPTLVEKWAAHALGDEKLAKLLGKMLKDGGGDDEAIMKELMALAGGGETDTPQRRFKHKQEVADRNLVGQLDRLQPKHHANYELEAATTKLRELAQAGAGNAEKEAAFFDMQCEVVGRAVGAVFALNALILVCRVEVNILGRHIDGVKGTANQTSALEQGYEGHTAFLQTWEFITQNGCKALCDLVREAVRDVSSSERRNLGPKTKVTPLELQEALLEICSEVTTQKLKSRSAEVLLPDTVTVGMTKEQLAVVGPLLDETKDMLDAPQFLEVLLSLVTASVKQVVSAVATEWPVPDGAAAPMAKVHKALGHLSNQVLTASVPATPADAAEEGAAVEANSSNDFVARAAENEDLQWLCEKLYFPPEDAA